MVLMNAAMSDAETIPSNPDGSKVNMAGYATSSPNLSSDNPGKAF